VRSTVPNVDTIRVEFDVKPRDTLLCAVPAGETEGEVSPGFSVAGSLELLEIDLRTSSVVSSERFVNPVPRSAAGPGARLAVALARRGVDTVLAREVEDAEALGTLEAYDIAVLTRPGTATVADAEAELLRFVGTLGDKAVEPGGGGQS
jgi:predicted Fe-Mo cluster-binding NifX family protein